MLKLAIECKNLKPHYPLLVSCTQRSREESYHHAILHPIKRSLTAHGTTSNSAGTQTSSTTATRVSTASVKFSYMDGSIFQPGEPVGKSTEQVGKVFTPPTRGDRNPTLIKPAYYSEDSEIYDGWSQAVSSCYDLVKDSTKDQTILGHPFVATVVQPVLVVADGTLWTVEYWKGEKVSGPNQMDRCNFYIGKRFDDVGLEGDYRISHMVIVTKTGLTKYLRGISTYEQNVGSEWEKLWL